MSRVTTLVYDDAIEVPPDIGALVGVDRFGSLLYRRRRLADHVAVAAREAGFASRVHLREPADRVAVSEELARSGARAVYLTADLACADGPTLARHLAKVAWADDDLVLRPLDADAGSALGSFGAAALRSLLACRGPAQRREWFRARAGLDALPAADLACLSDARALVRFLADTFYTRHFNRIAAEGRTITKRSADRRKMKREHDWWYLLPPALQRFVVQPFGYAEDAAGASYRLERLGVPDVAVLWVHGPDALPDDTFAVLLAAVFDWFAERPTRAVSPAEAHAAAEALYVAKVEERVASLRTTETGRRLDALIASGTRHPGLGAVVDRYLALLRADWELAPPAGPLAVMHGDLCFSNVLFDQRSGLLRLVDPRGAERAEELWGDPCYDLAKLSHSVLGGYDFVNNELFDVTLDGGLRLELRSDRPEPGRREAAFVQRVQAAGFDPVRVRLYEASLFLSMLPLHAEAPRKLAAFVLTAIGILDEVEAARARRPGLGGWLGRLLG